MTVFHILCRDYHEITAPPLDCTIWLFAHDLFSRHKREESSLRLGLLSQHAWPSFHTDRIDRAAVPPTTLAALAPASHTSSTRVCRFNACKLHQFHQDPTQWSGSWISCMFKLVSLDVATQHSRRSPSADCRHLKWTSQMVLLTTPSRSR